LDARSGVEEGSVTHRKGIQASREHGVLKEPPVVQRDTSRSASRIRDHDSSVGNRCDSAFRRVGCWLGEFTNMT
jgi:hypothetical protein